MGVKFGQRLRKIVGVVAPSIGAAVGGPLGGLAGKVLQDALGVDSDDAALAMIESNPDALLKLKEADRAFELRLAELDVDLERMAQADRASARTMAAATTLAPQIVISALFLLGYLTILGLFFADQLRIPMGEAFMVMLGVLTAGVTQVLNFWFGTSKGSQDKTALIGGQA